MALDEDYRREVLDEQRREDEAARQVEAKLSADERAVIAAEMRERARADDLASYGQVDCPECGAPIGQACFGRETSHYSRAVARVRRG